MKTIKIIVLIIILFLLISLKNKYVVYAGTYYPSSGIGSSDSPVPLEKGRSEIFASAEFAKYNNDDESRNVSVLLKNGLFENFDFTVAVPHSKTQPVEGENSHGMGEYTFGCKFLFKEETKASPSIGINFGVKPYSIRPENNGTGTTDYSSTFLLEKNVGDITCAFNFGYNFLQQTENSTPNHPYCALNFGYSPSKKTKCEIEVYGEKFLSQDTLNILNSTLKLSYNLNDNLQLQAGPVFNLKNQDFKNKVLIGLDYQF